MYRVYLLYDNNCPGPFIKTPKGNQCWVAVTKDDGSTVLVTETSTSVAIGNYYCLSSENIDEIIDTILTYERYYKITDQYISRKNLKTTLEASLIIWETTTEAVTVTAKAIEYGATCNRCKTHNEYVIKSKEDYICRSCRSYALMY